MNGPRGFAISDRAWVEAVASRYRFPTPLGPVVWERLPAHVSGRCFTYGRGEQPRTYAIGLSLPRLQHAGWGDAAETLGHELLHAWLWVRQGYVGHGGRFQRVARERGIAAVWHDVERPQQLRFDYQW